MLHYFLQLPCLFWNLIKSNLLKGIVVHTFLLRFVFIMHTYMNAHKLYIWFCFEAIKDLIHCDHVPLCLYRAEFVCMCWCRKEVSLVLFCAFLTPFCQLMKRCCFSYTIWRKRILCYPFKSAWRLIAVAVSQAFQFQRFLIPCCSRGWCLFATPQTCTSSHTVIPQVLNLQLSTLLEVTIWTSCTSPTFFPSAKMKAGSVLKQAFLISLLQNLRFRDFCTPLGIRLVPCLPCHSPSKALALHVLRAPDFVVGDRGTDARERNRGEGEKGLCFKKLNKRLR